MMVKTAAKVQEEVSEGLAGDLLKLCVSQLESLKMPWTMTNEKSQEVALNAMSEAIKNRVRESVNKIASRGMLSVAASVESVQFKDGVKAVLTLSKSQGAHDLADREGSTVLVVIADPDTFLGGTEAVKAKKDQPDLLESIPVFLERADGTYSITKDGMPLVGAPESFPTKAEAETWLKDSYKPGGSSTEPPAPA